MNRDERIAELMNIELMEKGDNIVFFIVDHESYAIVVLACGEKANIEQVRKNAIERLIEGGEPIEAESVD